MKTREDIRYALFRCKYGTAEASHTCVYDFYKSRVESLGLSSIDFSEKWDISKKDPQAVVTGAWVQVYKEELESPLIGE